MKFQQSQGFSLENLQPQQEDQKVKVQVTRSCLTPCDPMDCSPPGSPVHGILQARILEQVSFPPPVDLPDPGIEPRSPALLADSLISEPTGKPNMHTDRREIYQEVWGTQKEPSLYWRISRKSSQRWWHLKHILTQGLHFRMQMDK